MNEHEQNLADELEQIIQAAQANQGSTSSQTSSAEAELVQDLVHLSRNSKASPAFTANLGLRLKKRARELQTNSSSEQSSFWRDFQQLFKGNLTMKTTYALGAVLALIVFAALLVMGRGLIDDNITPIAEVTPIPVATVPSAIEEIDPIPTDTQPAEVTETETAVSPTVEILPPDQLAQLPRFDGQAVSGGLGGGGGISGEGALATSMMYADPFSGTTFVLNTTLPLEPGSGQVQQRLPETAVDETAARQIADQYGFSGPLYIETYPSDVPTEGPFVPSVTYFTFDGLRTLRIDSGSVNYSDEAASEKIDFENMVALPNAAALAEAFLRERGQLDFPYEVEVQPTGEVFFYHLIDGTAVIEPEIILTLNSEGEVAFSHDSVRAGWNAFGHYPLIPAEQAWQQVLAGVAENGIIVQTFTNKQNQPQPVAEPDFMADYQYWSREFTPNTEIHLYDWPQVFQPVGGGAPVLKVRNISIIADEDTLNGLVGSRDNQLHLWGILNADQTELQLTGWEALSEYNPIFQQGSILRQDDQVIFQSNEGSSFILPDAPVDLPEGLAVNVFGHGVRDIGLAFPVLDWENIDKYIEYPEEPIPQEMPIEPFESFQYEQVQIDSVALAYVTTYLWPDESLVGGDAVVTKMSPTIFLQPAWAFKGTANNGDTITLFVQAVSPDYLQP